MTNLTIIGAVPILILSVLWMALKEHRKVLSNCLSLALAAYVCFGIMRLLQNPAFFHRVEILSLAESSESTFRNPYLLGIHANPKYRSAFKPYPWLLDLYLAKAKKGEEALGEASSLSAKFAAYDAIVLFVSDEKFDQALTVLSQSKDSDGPALAKDLEFSLGILPDQRLSDAPRLIKETEMDLKTRLEPSWYRDVALESLYTRWSDSKRLEQFRSEKYARDAISMMRDMNMTMFGFAATVIGALVCLAQPIIWWLRKRGFGKRWLDPAQTFPPYKLRTVIDVVVAYLAIRTFAGGLLRDTIYGSLMPETSKAFESMASLTAVTLLINGSGLLFAYLLAFRPSGVSFADGIGLRFRSGNIGPFKMILVGLLAFCALFPFVLVATGISKCFGGGETANPITIFMMMVARSGDSGAIVLSALLLAFIGPFLEEALCRGFLFSTLRAKYGVTTGVLVSSFLFAAMHLDLTGFLPLFSIGVVLALAYQKTNSIVPGLIAHCAWNGLSFASTLLTHHQ